MTWSVACLSLSLSRLAIMTVTRYCTWIYIYVFFFIFRLWLPFYISLLCLDCNFIFCRFYSFVIIIPVYMYCIMILLSFYTLYCYSTARYAQHLFCEFSDFWYQNGECCEKICGAELLSVFDIYWNLYIYILYTIYFWEAFFCRLRFCFISRFFQIHIILLLLN